MDADRRGAPPVALEARSEEADGRRFSPSVARNRDVICEGLKARLPQPAHVLEIASGTGEHGAFFTDRIASLSWTYSDIDNEGLASQRAWRASAAHQRLHGPLPVDASLSHWAAAERPGAWDAVFSANMIHIAPIAAVRGLIAGAGRLLGPDGQLVLYGPFVRHGEMAASNAAFSEALRARNPLWGVRDLDEMIFPLARAAGLVPDHVEAMPANNLMVYFRRRQAGGQPGGA